MKNILLMLLASFLFVSCNNSVNVDTSEWSGITNQNDEKSKIVEKLAKGYTDGDFGIAKDYFTPDGEHKVNNDVYTVEEIINGYNFHSFEKEFLAIEEEIKKEISL